MNKRFRLLLTPLLLSGLLMQSACENRDPDRRATVDYEATLNSAQLVGVDQSSTATGTFTGVYNKESKVLSYTLTLAGVTPTQVYIAQAQPGVSNGIADIILPNPQGGTLTGETALSQRQENDLIYGNYAVIVRSAQYPNGAIRGNIQVRKY
ncbi:CHRD domain-containing protein [Fibrisoma limi]|nr:CHRD domain-containing protein [Fibrisoma limi]